MGASRRAMRDQSVRRAARLSVESLESRLLLAAALVRDINPAVLGIDTTQLTDVNGTAYLSRRCTSGSGGNDLYRSDGTPQGTTLVRTFSGGSFGPTLLTASGGLLYFRLNSGTRQIWRTDGTPAGTFAVSSFTFNGVFPDQLTDVNGNLFFYVQRGTSDREIWKSDGTPAGTVLVKSVNGSIGVSEAPQNFTNVNGTLYFTANNGVNGVEVWKSDGTPAGTVMVADVRPGSASSTPRNLINVNGTLYFTADDGTRGTELWRTDGTAAGTVLLKDIRPGSTGSAPHSLTVMNGALYFGASSPPDPGRAFRTRSCGAADGTEAGTAIVKDINPGPAGAFPSDLRTFNNNLYFTATGPDPATNGLIVRQMWQSDGTNAGTRASRRREPGPGRGNTHDVHPRRRPPLLLAHKPTCGGPTAPRPEPSGSIRRPRQTCRATARSGHRCSSPPMNKRAASRCTARAAPTRGRTWWSGSSSTRSRPTPGWGRRSAATSGSAPSTTRSGEATGRTRGP